jgi:hypothetical protein
MPEEFDFEAFQKLIDERCFLCLSQHVAMDYQTLLGIPLGTRTIKWPCFGPQGQPLIEEVLVCTGCGEAHKNDHRVPILRQTVPMGRPSLFWSAEQTICSN